MIKISKIETTPLMNLLKTKQGLDKFQEILLLSIRNRPRDQTTISLHKNVFGKQNKTMILGSRRYYLWIRNEWIVFVHNEEGASFEVNANLTESEALSEYESYIKQLCGL